ncbi:unnamed protein product [Effrenium voratum]|uniref:Uncharacterized protein n=1 Tax=Effrenium voratum TaxID=2562239 RepID=A0AA36IP54_9DINO|nr:unnamed protein product [Effrenium voratum]
MAPKQLPVADAKAKATTKAKAKAKAQALQQYAEPDVPTPFDGNSDDFIAQLLQMEQMEEMMGTVASSSNDTIDMVLPQLVEKLEGYAKAKDALQSVKNARIAIAKASAHQVETEAKAKAKSAAADAQRHRNITLSVTFMDTEMEITVSAFVSIGEFRRIIINQWNMMNAGPTMTFANSKRIRLSLDGVPVLKHPRSKLYTSGFDNDSEVTATMMDEDDGEEEDEDEEGEQ